MPCKCFIAALALFTALAVACHAPAEQPRPTSPRPTPRRAAPGDPAKARKGLAQLIQRVRAATLSKKAADFAKILQPIVPNAPKGCQFSGRLSALVFPEGDAKLGKAHLPPGVLVVATNWGDTPAQSRTHFCAIWMRQGALVAKDIAIRATSAPEKVRWSEHPAGHALLTFRVVENKPVPKSEDANETTNYIDRDVLLLVGSRGPQVIGVFDGEYHLFRFSTSGEAKLLNSDRKQTKIELQWYVIDGRHVLGVERRLEEARVRDEGANEQDCSRTWSAYRYDATKQQLVQIKGQQERTLLGHSVLKPYRKFAQGKSGSCGESD